MSYFGQELSATFPSYEEAEKCLNDLRYLQSEYGIVKVSEFFNLIGRKFPIEAYDYGWYDLSACWIRGESDGSYVLLMPPVKHLLTREKDISNDGLCTVESTSITLPKAASDYGDTMVDHPPHYQSETGLEVIDIIEAFTFDLKGIEAVDTANILKYACRWSKKNGVQDLKKILWYTNHLINHIEKLQEENKYEN